MIPADHAPQDTKDAQRSHDFRTLDDVGDRFGMKRMNGPEQCRGKRNALALGTVPAATNHQSEHSPQGQHAERVQKDIDQVVPPH